MADNQIPKQKRERGGSFRLSAMTHPKRPPASFAKGQRKMEKCKECKKEPVYIKKVQLCKSCYRRNYNASHKYRPLTIEQVIQHKREMEFVRNFFGHQNWHYHPAIFRINGTKYEPDFYDNERGVFIEVAGTKQAFWSNRDKYLKFTKTFPDLKFEIRHPSGKLIDITAKRQQWPD